MNNNAAHLGQSTSASATRNLENSHAHKQGMETTIAHLGQYTSATRNLENEAAHSPLLNQNALIAESTSASRNLENGAAHTRCMETNNAHLGQPMSSSATRNLENSAAHTQGMTNNAQIITLPAPAPAQRGCNTDEFELDAANPDVAVRARVAAQPDLPPAIRWHLALGANTADDIVVLDALRARDDNPSALDAHLAARAVPTAVADDADELLAAFDVTLLDEPDESDEPDADDERETFDGADEPMPHTPEARVKFVPLARPSNAAELFLADARDENHRTARRILLSEFTMFAAYALVA